MQYEKKVSNKKKQLEILDGSLDRFMAQKALDVGSLLVFQVPILVILGTKTFTIIALRRLRVRAVETSTTAHPSISRTPSSRGASKSPNVGSSGRLCT